MSNLPGNPHEELANEWSGAVSGDGTDAENQIFAQCATAEATLALAYEQRTANLIALHQMTVNSILAGATTADTESLNRNSEEIETRLGLGESK